MTILHRMAMTSFGWKRKFSAKVSSASVAAFGDPDENSDGVESSTADNVFLALAKKRKMLILEDCVTKSERLVKEGITLAEAERYSINVLVEEWITLAEAERYWEAIKKWDEAIQLTPGKSEIYEMKAQAQMELSEVFPAVQSAEKAVSLNPSWWVAYQTLARAQLGLGEVELAKRTISRAIHLRPAERELWEEDLPWIQSLCEQKRTMKPTMEQENG